MAESPPPPSLPEILPVFPLTGSLLLPGNYLPLNIFEERYRNMVEDVMQGDRCIGMIQPFVPRQDNRIDPSDPQDPDEDGSPVLYTVGCAGRIDRCEPQNDGRYLILLRGLSRFRIRRELPLRRGYRRVEAEYSGFPLDPRESEIFLNPSRLLHALRGFSERQELSFDFDLLSSLPGVTLLNGLSVALPFRPEEKQALLEAADPSEREETLLTLLGMGIAPLSADDEYQPPTLN